MLPTMLHVIKHIQGGDNLAESQSIYRVIQLKSAYKRNQGSEVNDKGIKGEEIGEGRVHSFLYYFAVV